MKRVQVGGTTPGSGGLECFGDLVLLSDRVARGLRGLGPQDSRGLLSSVLLLE